MKKIAIIEDNRLLAELISDKIQESLTDCEIKRYTDPLLFLADPQFFDLILLDIVIPEMGGLEAIPLILKKQANAAIVINSIKDDSETIFKALQLGAVGYIDKQSFDLDFKEVFASIESGGAYMTPKIARLVVHFFQKPKTLMEQLTPREADMVKGIMDGLSYKLIADQFQISINTVKMNIKNIYKKLNINSKGELFKILTK